MEKPKSNQSKDTKAAAKPAVPAAPVKVAPMFRPTDWLTLAITFGVVWIVYLFTLAPEQTLEDSGELCTAAYYAGIPHPPGYPFWSVYAWFWTLIVSRGSSMLIEGIEVIKDVPRQWENAICSVSGFVAGTLLGFDVFMWSE